MVIAGLFSGYRWRVAAHRARARELARKIEERTADLRREIAEHKLTEQRLATERDLRHALMERRGGGGGTDAYCPRTARFAGSEFRRPVAAARGRGRGPSTGRRSAAALRSMSLRACCATARPRPAAPCGTSALRSANPRRYELTLERALAPLLSSSKPRIEVRVDPEDAGLRPQMQRDVVRIAEEAVTNAVKHASATLISVACRIRADEVWLEVHDDGQGFELRGHEPARSAASACSACVSAPHRIGARLEIVSRRGAGTWVVLRCPRTAALARLKALRRATLSREGLDNLSVPTNGAPEDESS